VVGVGLLARSLFRQISGTYNLLANCSELLW
jgi:hypothetical protein